MCAVHLTMVGRAQIACDKAVEELCGRLDDQFFRHEHLFFSFGKKAENSACKIRREASGLLRDGCGKFKAPVFKTFE